MKYEFKIQSNQVIVKLQGSLYVDSVAELREEFISYTNSGYYNFVVNLAELDYIDSSGLGVLVAIQKRAVQNKGKVTIAGLRGTVKELFEMTRLTNVFDVIG